MATTVGGVAALDLELKPLADAFKRAPALIDRNMLVAMSLVGTLITNRAKTVHEYTDRTGLLTQSITPSKPEGSFLSGTLSVDVKAGGARVKYGLYVEEGTKPHRIEPKRKKFLRFAPGGQYLPGGRVFSRGVNHPGTRAYKFMSNALEFIVETRAPEVFEDALLDALDEALGGV